MAHVAGSRTVRRIVRVPGKRFFGGVAQFFELLGAAIRVSTAVEARRRPDARDLATLGINGLDLPLPR